VIDADGVLVNEWIFSSPDVSQFVWIGFFKAFRWVLSVMFLLKKSRIFCLENHFVRQKKGPTSLTPIL